MKGLQQPGQIHGGGLALGVRVGGHDDLLNAPGGHPLHQGADVQVVRADVVHGGEHPVKNVVQPVVLPAALHGDHVFGIGDHADGGAVPFGAGADGAGAASLGEVLADGTAVDGGFGINDGPGESGGLFFRKGKDVESQALGGFDSDSGQLGEVLDQIFQRGGKVLHVHVPLSAAMAAGMSAAP